MTPTAHPWPYPRWIAHRGAGQLAPENTLAAFRLGASFGYRMFECDVKLSADDVPFLLHDTDLLRTTNAQAALGAHADDKVSLIGGDHDWATLSRLDAGSWHSPAFADEPLPTLQAVARYCLANAHFLNIEIKPTPGLERHTGEVVAQHVARLWPTNVPSPLLTSFEVTALAGARQAQAQLPRGLLLKSLWTGWLETAKRLGCVAIVAEQTLWNASNVGQAKNAGLRCLSYTVNDATQAQRLLGLGLDGLITDRVNEFDPGL